MEIAIIGERDFTIGFQLCGIKNITNIEESDYSEFNSVFMQTIENAEVGIIVVNEGYYQKVPVQIRKKLEKLVSPVVVTLSDEESAGGVDLRNLIKRSLGVDLWKE